MRNEVDDVEDDDDEHGIEDSGREDSESKCPKCMRIVKKTELMHPVIIAFNADSNLILFFHDSCHKALSSKEVEKLVRDSKFDLMLSSPEDDDLSSC